MTVGRVLLVCALLVALYGVAAAIGAARTRDERLVASARRSVYVVAALTAAAFVLVELAYLRDDFAWSLVAGNSSSTTPLYYKLTAVWSSQAGSLLLWLLILSFQAALAVRIAHRRYRALEPVAAAVLLICCAFFVALMVVWESPFAASDPVPAEGNGLQPLLRYPLMAAHPVALYLGYAGFAVPFAFAVAALVRGQLDASWLVATRRFTLAAWGFLALGLVLGSRWSYAELGWGGYWGWDPVENAALLPWLTATALLHSSLVQEKRGMLKVWNVSLVAASFLLALTGTFLVRSGILDSIHAFGASTLGVPFLAAIGVTISVSVALIVWRTPQLRSEHRLDSLLSREAIFLLNNLVLVALAFVVFWGTFFPLISDALTGDRASVGPPWFERYIAPLGIVLALLTGLGPLLAWRRTSLRGLLRLLRVPVGFAVVVLVVCVVAFNARERPPALVAFVIVAFTLAALCGEFARGTRVRRRATGSSWPAALAGLLRRNRRRYGGYLVHVGFAVLLLGVAASSSFALNADHELRPGQRMDVGEFQLTYRAARADLGPEKLTLGTVVEVRQRGRLVATLRPSRELYPAPGGGGGIVGRYFNGPQTSEIGLRASAVRDVWVAAQPDLAVLEEAVKEGARRFGGSSVETQTVIVAALLRRWQSSGAPVTFRIFVRPGVTWIWLGAMLLGVGAMIAGWPARRRRVFHGPPPPAPEALHRAPLAASPAPTVAAIAGSAD